MKPDLRPILGQTVTVTIDRPLGSAHPRHPDIVYPVNYGFLPGVTGGDGEEQDVYILGVDVPIERFTGNVIAIVHRTDDDEDKLVAAPAGRQFSEAEIEAALRFQEQYFPHTIQR
ncbi:MAG: inorganic pyrophosphatase [Clostridia bacterium]|nr:inorganic pyrophosphatase [Clostridia bacterium]